MLDDRRLDTKLAELARELRTRPLVQGFPIADAFTVQGVDEAGRAGLFAAILLTPNSEPELDTLTAFRDVLTRRLRQLDSTLPAWPIVVQGAPELADGVAVVPGGQEYFQQLKGELTSRGERLKAVQAKKATLERSVRQSPPMPVLPVVNDKPRRASAAVAKKPVAVAKKAAKVAKPAKPVAGRKTTARKVARVARSK